MAGPVVSSAPRRAEACSADLLRSPCVDLGAAPFPGRDGAYISDCRGCLRRVKLGRHRKTQKCFLITLEFLAKSDYGVGSRDDLCEHLRDPGRFLREEEARCTGGFLCSLDCEQCRAPGRLPEDDVDAGSAPVDDAATDAPSKAPTNCSDNDYGTFAAPNSLLETSDYPSASNEKRALMQTYNQQQDARPEGYLSEKHGRMEMIPLPLQAAPVRRTGWLRFFAGMLCLGFGQGD